MLKELGIRIGSSFLDAGCGEGSFSLPASKMVGNKGRVYAIDISEEAVNLLKEEIEKRNIQNIEVFLADIGKNIPVENETIDVCLMANVLHGFVANKEVESILKGIFRVLKPDGMLGVVDFKKIEGPPGPPMSIRMTPEEVEEIISRYGFKKRKEVEVGKYHYAVIFNKH